jgi:hypothetical protein
MDLGSFVDVEEVQFKWLMHACLLDGVYAAGAEGKGGSTYLTLKG